MPPPAASRGVGNRDHDEADGFDKWTRLGQRPLRADRRSAASSSASTAPPDRPTIDGSPGSGTDPATPATPSDNRWLTGYGRLSFASPDGGHQAVGHRLRHLEHRHNFEPGRSADLRLRLAHGRRRISGELRHGALGQLLGGARLEQETGGLHADTIRGVRPAFDDTATRYALFAGDQISPIDHLFLTFSGRYDGQHGRRRLPHRPLHRGLRDPGDRDQAARQPRHRRQAADLLPAAYNLDAGITDAAAIGEEHRRRRRHRPGAVRRPADPVGDRLPEPVHQPAQLRLRAAPARRYRTSAAPTMQGVELAQRRWSSSRRA